MRKSIVLLLIALVMFWGCSSEQEEPIEKQDVKDSQEAPKETPKEQPKPVTVAPKPEPVRPEVLKTPETPKDAPIVEPVKPKTEARAPIAGKLKTAFIYVGPVGDAGWSWSHDQGRKKMMELCGDLVERADYVESVPDSPQAIPIIEKFAKEGYHLIFTTSFGHMDPTLEVAKKYPGTVFMHCSGHKLSTNMGNYFGRIHEADYLCGLVAGKMSTKNKIGYVAPHPISEVIRGINAFAVGARQSNPNAQVFVRWTHTWYDPEKERASAESLLSQEGVDIMAQGQDSPTALLCAQEEGILGVGYNCDMSRFAREAHLTSSIWDWSKLYVALVKAVKEGTWKSEHIWWGMDQELVDIAPLSERVPKEVQNLVKNQRAAIINKSFKIFNGPLKNQNGELVVPGGKSLSEQEEWDMNYFVEGVVGDIPQAVGLETMETRKMEKIKVGFVYISNIGDAGWTKAHDEARQALATLPFVTGTEYVENVEEEKEKTRQAIEKLIKKGCNLIFTTSWGFMDPTLDMAKKYPELIFMHCSGFKVNHNMGTYFGRMYQARYLSGLIAGKMTKTNKIGYLLPFPIPECIRGANAFAIGVREVNPNATVQVVWTSTWYNPEKEREVATEMIENGCDLLTQHQDSPAAVLVAKENEKWAIGYDSDMGPIAPEAHLTSPIWHWGKICVPVAEQLRAGTWKSEQIWWGLEKGVVDLAPINPKVPQEVKDLVEKRKKDIIAGTYKIFQGPLKDQKGEMKLKPGEILNDQQLLSMMFFVEGVVGTIKTEEEKKPEEKKPEEKKPEAPKEDDDMFDDFGKEEKKPEEKKPEEKKPEEKKPEAPKEDDEFDF